MLVILTVAGVPEGARNFALSIIIPGSRSQRSLKFEGYGNYATDKSIIMPFIIFHVHFLSFTKP